MEGSSQSVDEQSTRPRRELGLRVISALVLAPLAIASAYAGGAVFELFWLIAALGVMWEWMGLVTPSAQRIIVLCGGMALAGAVLLYRLDQPALAVLFGLFGAGMSAGLAPRQRAGFRIAGFCYAAAMMFAPVLIRAGYHDGFLAIILLFVVVWTTDILAYFIGRLTGGPKLWRAISPNKTWSGAVGGTVCASLAGLGVAVWVQIGNLSAIVLLCVGLSIVSQLGDLFESALKRRFGTKDASHLIPGHGGLMDRLDGFVAAAFVAAILGILRGGLDEPARGLLIW